MLYDELQAEARDASRRLETWQRIATIHANNQDTVKHAQGWIDYYQRKAALAQRRIDNMPFYR